MRPNPPATSAARGRHGRRFDRVGKIAGSVVARPCAENAILTHPTSPPISSNASLTMRQRRYPDRNEPIGRTTQPACRRSSSRTTCMQDPRPRGQRRGGCAGRSFAYVSALRHAAAIQPAGAASVGAAGRRAAARRRDLMISTCSRICGSLRKGSYNRALMNALPGLAPAGMTLSRKRPRFAASRFTMPTCRRPGSRRT